MTKHRALIVDDEADIRELLEITLGRMAIDTTPARNLDEARRCLADEPFDLCLADMRLPDGDGIELVRTIAAEYPKLPVAIITAHGHMDAAIAALKAGAFDFVSKPVDIDDLRNLVQQALQLAAGQAGEQEQGANELIGDSPPLQHLRDQIRKVARSQAPVVLIGESGVGKELAARMIHRLGPRARAPFVPVNCGAIPGELMESEFFGHRKGSFTGAVTDKDGLFAAAHGGTLFLDEIVELPPDMQVKLLRAIQERRVRPVGATQETPVDARIVCASHQDLDGAIADGRLREDLYYRINVIALSVPPLRERPEDLPALTDAILHRLAQRYGQNPPALTDEARAALTESDFPGNVRELENILERALALAEHDTLAADDLQLPARARSVAQAHDAATTATSATAADPEPDAANVEARVGGGASLDAQMAASQRRILTDSLERHRWNRTAAARELGLTYRQLRYRLKKFGID